MFFSINISSMKKESKMKNGIIGAIVGDIVGSRFEWHNRKTKRFTFLKKRVNRGILAFLPTTV